MYLYVSCVICMSLRHRMQRRVVVNEIYFLYQIHADPLGYNVFKTNLTTRILSDT